MNKLLVIIVSFFAFQFGSIAQLISVSPAFPTANDVVTITYKANEGNAALTGVSTVYAHMGLITSTSTSNTNWQFVQGVWGTADANVLMTNIGNNTHQITVDISTFYGFPGGTVVNKLAFVFRNAAGTIVGRNADGSDILYDVYPSNAGFLSKIFEPTLNTVVNLNDQLPIIGKTNQTANLSLKDNGVLVNSVNNAIELSYAITANTPGDHIVEFIADNGTEIQIDTLMYVVNPTVNAIDPPSNTVDGLNRIDDNTILIRLFAPEKNNVYVIGDFNDWSPSISNHMNRSVDGKTWWLQISGLTPDVVYGYQFYIDGSLKLADPYSLLIADKNNDGSISASVYPDPYSYPNGLTDGFISLFKTNNPSFNWQNDGFTKPQNKELVIYELLVRDFIATHNYQTLADTIQYLANMGINAIELMPVNEYENNESWGYNPSFHMALDKYYGTPEHFKAFVDICHEKGIAVIMDIALNHAFGQNPMVNMYWDAANNRTAANNPWFNVICPHDPYCWGYDLNHEAQATKNYIDRINHYWLNEFHIDGFRFDYTKGFVNSAATYSNTRIDILKRMADTIWATHPEAYIILEHWADNNEEKILSDYGMMLWGNLTYEYHQAMKGSGSNFSNGIYTARGWTNPHLITYVESHDEERGVFEAVEFGSVSNLAHTVKDNLPVALLRAQTAAVLMLTAPGPKMIWQFGELGYDYSIDYGCRVCNKPILWNYFLQNNRRQLYDVYSATIKLKTQNEVFKSGTLQYALSSTVKRLTYTHPTMDAVVLGNFAVQNSITSVSFPQQGWWFEYYTGDSLQITQTSTAITLKPAEYRVYTTTKLTKPEILSTVGLEELMENSFEMNLFPNPTVDEMQVQFDLKEAGNVNLKVIDLNGSLVLEKEVNNCADGLFKCKLNVSSLEKGTYLILVQTNQGFKNQTFIKE